LSILKNDGKIIPFLSFGRMTVKKGLTRMVVFPHHHPYILLIFLYRDFYFLIALI